MSRWRNLRCLLQSLEALLVIASFLNSALKLGLDAVKAARLAIEDLGVAIENQGVTVNGG